MGQGPDRNRGTTSVQTDPLLRLAGALWCPDIERHDGIAGNAAIVVRGVLKTGPVESVGREFEIYEDLKDRLGELYNAIFPKVFLRHRDERVAILEVAWLGHSLSEVVFRPLAWGEWAAALSRWPDSDLVANKLAIADNAIGLTLDHLETLFRASQRRDQELTEQITIETLAALRTNLHRAHLIPELEQQLNDVEHARDLWSARSVISCCHRDLMAQHIYLDWSEDHFEVRLADPRPALPIFDSTPAALARKPTSLGCAAVDFAHLELSLDRRQFELRRIQPGITLRCATLVDNAVKNWISNGRFSAAFYELALATWYANYAGWPAKLGKNPPPELEGLYDHMVQQARHRLQRCSDLAAGRSLSA